MFSKVKNKWGKWKDFSVITSKGAYTLLQVRECQETGEKEYAQRKIGWVNSGMSAIDIRNKTNINETEI